MRDNPSPGFTLIELSIVLVIVGLLIGGIVVGSEMIRAASLRNVMSEKEQIETAITTFKLKYSCVPGDCARASRFFGGAPDGNGNETVDDLYATSEVLYAAYHLSLANLVALPMTNPLAVSPTINGMPILKPGYNTFGSTAIANLGWMLRTAGDMHGTSSNSLLCGDEFDNSKNQLFFGSNGQTLIGWDNVTPNGGINARQAWTLDMKYDDGMPYTGRMRTFGIGGTPNNLSTVHCGQSFLTASYRTGDPGGYGAVVFLVDF